MMRRQISAHGEEVKLRRVAGTAMSVVAEVAVRAKVSGYRPEEMVGGFQQGDQRVIFLAEDIDDFPVPIRENSVDRIVIGNAVFTVRAVDQRSKRVAGVLIAYDLRIRG